MSEYYSLIIINLYYTFNDKTLQQCINIKKLTFCKVGNNLE